MRTDRFERKHHLEAQEKRYLEGQYNVCGVIVDVAPEKIIEVQQSIAQLAGCEILYTKSSGRMALTVEDTQQISSYDYLDQISHMDHVLSISLISHHFE